MNKEATPKAKKQKKNKPLRKHELNFFLRYKADPAKEKLRNTIILASLPVIAVIGVLASIIVNQERTKAALTAEIDQYNVICFDPVLMETYSNSYLMDEQIAILSEETEALNAFRAVRNTYPKIGSKVLETIFSCTPPSMSVTQFSCMSSKGEVSFTLTSANPVDIPEYIRTLKATGLFDSVGFNSYSDSDSSENAAASYSFGVQMHLCPSITEEEFLAQYFGTEDYSDILADND